METDELREALESAGLTQYEASAYVALVGLGTAAAVEVADACDVPQARIYDVLRDLEKKGYIETYQHGSLHARAHDPEAILENLESYASTISQAAEEIKHRWEKPTIENHKVSVVKRFSTVFDRAREAIEDAENELQIAVTPNRFEDLIPTLADAHERDVVTKLTMSPESGDEAPYEEYLDDLAGTVTEARFRRIPTPFVVQADRTQVFFAPETTLHPANEYGVLVNDYSLSQVFDWYFQTGLWEYWEVIYSARDDSLPSVYTKVRECIRTIQPYFDEGHEVVVTVYGQDSMDAESVQLTGTVTDIVYTSGDGDFDSPPLASFVEQASLVVDTGEKEVTVGGYGALFEEIEARRLIVEAID